MVAFPGAFHFGYNEGFNCSEALNFGTEQWIKYIKAGKVRLCGSACTYVGLKWPISAYLDLYYANEGIEDNEDTSEDFEPKIKRKKASDLVKTGGAAKKKK